jgi:hypothetical protein
MRRALAAAATAAIILALAPQASAAPCCYAGWHWKRASNPFVVTILSSVQSKWVTPLTNAVNEWSTSDKFDMHIVQGNTSAATRSNCGQTSGEVHVCNSNYGATGWAGLTELTLNGQHIVKLRVRLNDYYTTPHFRRLIACHELGHSVGLGHRSQPSSCMMPGSGSRKHPDATDFAEIDAIYKHLDSVAAPTTTDNTTRTITFYDRVPPQ